MVRENAAPGGRRLAAIMFTDIVGYTALGQKNESLSLAVLDEQRKLLRPLFKRHNGREIKTIGDAFLVEFGSALDAIRCAYDIQRVVREYDISLPEESRIHLRVGVHLGDVTVSEDGDISGDAVNVASRIEPLADEGGVCVSGQVYEHVRNKIDLPFESIGKKSLKNVGASMEVYRMMMPWGGGENTQTRIRLDTHRIAVLPFANISPDPGDGYFADGLTEELISKLSRVEGLKVIARTSTMKYKGKEMGIREIGTELGSGALVEGSVRKAGDRIRVTVQLIDANTDEHLWSSNYDSNLDDIFAVQSDIAAKISDSLPGRLRANVSQSKVQRDTENITAYTYYLKGKQLLYERTDSSIRRALELFIDATKLDPSFARAYASIGSCYAELEVRSYISKEESSSGMRSAAEKALEIDPDLDEGHSLMSYTAWGMDDFATAEKEARRAIELNPNLSSAHQNLSILLLSIGYPKKALDSMQTAQVLDPLSPWVIRTLGQMLYYNGREADALDLWRRSMQVAPFDVHLGLATYYMGKGDISKVEEEVRELERLSPTDFSTLCSRGYITALKGDREGADKIIEMLERNFRGGATVERNVGYIRYFLGDMDSFFDAMFHAAEARVLDPLALRYAPFFGKAREDIRYGELLKKVGLDRDLKEQP